MDELKATVGKYNESLKGFNKDTLELFTGVTDTNNTFSSFIETKMLEKIKDIPKLLNEGITLLPEVTRQLNKFNDNISKKKGDTKAEKQDFYDKCLTNLLQMTKKVDDQVYNSDKGIDLDFRDLTEKVTNIKKEIEKSRYL